MTLRYYPFNYALLFLAVCLFALTKTTLLNIDDVRFLLPWLAVALFAGVIGWRCQYQDLDKSLALLIRGLAIFIGIYLAFAWPSFEVPSGVGTAGVAWFYQSGRWIALVATLVALLRPTLIIVPMVYVVLYKHGASLITGITLSPTDYAPLAELGIFITYSLLLFTFFERSHFLRKYVDEARPEQWAPTLLLFMTALALHFGNYLWSGVEKLLLDGGADKWLMENQTQYMILVANSAGKYPLSHWADLAATVYRGAEQSGFAINLLTLAAQLFSIVALVRIRWALWLTLFYDLTHIAIFLLTGIFFWKWILLNLALVAALATLAHRRIPRVVVAMAVVTIMLGQLVFFTARLGWYDTRAYNHNFLVAHTSTGDVVPVPSNYFLTTSVAFAQERIGRPFTGHFPTLTYGSTTSYQTMLNANNCLVKPFEKTASVVESTFSRRSVEQIVKDHHRFMVGIADENGQVAYDLYPHHIFSNPMEFADFKNLDLRTIVGYEFVVESVCLGIDENGFTEDLVFRSQRTINIH